MNELLIKLKNSINKKIYNQISVAAMEQHLFVPINVRDNYLFVAINSQTDKEQVSDILRETFTYTIKYIQLSNDDLLELIKSSNINIDLSATNERVKESRHKIGEMLIDDGIITDAQLLEAMAESKKTKMPVGSVLCKLGYVSLEQLKRYLKVQTGIDFVTEEMKIFNGKSLKESAKEAARRAVDFLKFW